MRKRLVVAAIAAVIGLAVYVIWRPERGTVEYHKKEYMAARDGRTAFNLLRRLLNSIFGELRYQHVIDSDRMVIHRAALIKRGYVEAVTFSVSNQPSAQVVWSVHRANRAGPKLEHFGLERYGDDAIRIWVVTNDLVKWQQMVREVDAAERR